jgi:hypothetical protein
MAYPFSSSPGWLDNAVIEPVLQVFLGSAMSRKKRLSWRLAGAKRPRRRRIRRRYFSPSRHACGRLRNRHHESWLLLIALGRSWLLLAGEKFFAGPIHRLLF